MEHTKRVLHLDMDAFYASVEQQDNPELRGKPVIIGRNMRGVVSAASYEARVFGVRSAMPVAQAKRLCPHGEYLPGRMSRYAEVSRQVMAVLGEVSPLVEQASVDEAYVDVTGVEKLFGPPEAVARLLQDRVRAVTGLSCSIGVAPVKFVAKIASDFRKPGGITVVEPEAVLAFLETLPVGRIPGVGARMLARLADLGVVTCADVRRYSLTFWEDRLGEWGRALFDRAWGRGSNRVVTEHETKSSSAENTFDADTADPRFLKRWLTRQSERVGADLRAHGWKGRTVTLKVKFADFRQITRSKTIAPTDSDEVIYATAAGLLDQVSLAPRVRLIGVGVSNFAKSPEQLSLFPDERVEKMRRIDKALDAIRGKHGRGAVRRGRTMEERDE
ncbi:DNA polymerase IV [Fundidesulfovibrio butyratiphilus]